MHRERLELDLAYACFLLLGAGALGVLGLFALEGVVPVSLEAGDELLRIFVPVLLAALGIALAGATLALRLRNDGLLGVLTAATVTLGIIGLGLVTDPQPGLRAEASMMAGLVLYGVLTVSLSLDWFLSRRRSFELALGER